MATIQLTALVQAIGEPHIPSELPARINWKEWPGGGLTPVLKVQVGSDALEIWPADPDKIYSLGRNLLRLAEELRRAHLGVRA